MKVALITDQHFGARNDSIHFLDYYEKFYKETFFPELKKQKIKTVLILGDTFDRRKYVNFYSLKRAKEMFFDVLAKENIQVYMLAGNHDTYYKNTNDVNSVDLLLREYDNVEVIDVARTIKIKNFDVCMIPWICADNYTKCLEEMRITPSKLCMGHFEIAGFAMHRGMPSEEGLNHDIFRSFDRVFSGHYHHKSSNHNIQYLGNPYELTWQDYADDRGFHIFDLATYDLRFVRNPNVMFHRIVYDDKTNDNKTLLNQDFSKYTGTYVKVVVVNKTNPYLFDQFMNGIHAVNPLDTTIVEDALDLTDGVEDDRIDEAEDTVTIINKYVDAIETEGIDNSRLKNMLRELYVEALNLEQT